MSNRPDVVVNQFNDSLYRMKNAVDTLSALSAVDVNTIRVAIDTINGAFLSGQQAYQIAVARTGSGAAAQAFFAQRLFDVPADISASLSAINQSYNALATAYDGLVPNQGVRAFTYDGTTKAHSDIDGTAARNSLLPELQALQSALAPLTPQD